MPSASEVRAYREKHGCSLVEAATAVKRRDLRREIDQATSLEDLKAILRKLAG
jgi:hypothetical protein